MAYTLTVNGSEQNLTTRRISLDLLQVSWKEPRRLVFVQHLPHSDADYTVEDHVALSVDGTTRFRGRIKRVELDGSPGDERVLYTALGLRESAVDVTVCDPDHGFPRVPFNAPPGDEDYDAGRSGKTIGQIIAWLFDQHAAQLRAAGVIAEAPATGYLSDDLDALDVVPPKLVFESQHFDAALCSLMRLQRGARFLADPETQTFRFRTLSSLPGKTLTYNSADKPLAALLKPSTRGRATALEIYGPRRPVNHTLTLDEAELTKLWDDELEDDWTWPKAFDPDNADTYARVYRRFQITAPANRPMARRLAEPAALGDTPPAWAPQVYRKTADDSWAPVPASFDFENGILLLAQPATVGDEYAEGDAACAEDLALVYAGLSDPLSVRVPESGYQGTAYSRPGNPLEVVRRIYDEAFIRPDQESDVADLAEELLAAYQDVVYAGTVKLAQLDWSLADLAHRLSFAAKDDDGDPVTTGFESLHAVLLGTTYDFAHGRTDLLLSTYAAELRRGYSGFSASLRELGNQARRTVEHRAAQPAAGGSPRLGCDGQTGALANARGVYSVRRYQDSETDRVAGHLDLEAGPGLTITRQVDANHNGFQLAAPRGQWFPFTCFISTGDESGPWTKTLYVPGIISSPSSAGEIELPAGKVTAIRVAFATNITAGTITFTPRKGAPADSRADGDIDSWTDYTVPGGSECVLSSGVCTKRVDGWSFELSDADTLGLKAVASADFAADLPTCLYARLYFEETD